jgi:hypothetical protein
MALVADTVWTISLTYVDRDKNKSVVQIYVPAALTNTEATVILNGVVAEIAPLTDAVLLKTALSIGSLEDTWPATPAVETSDVERYAEFIFSTDRPPVKSKISIPSFLGTKVIDGTNTVNTSDADVSTFMAYMINTGIGVGNSPVGYAGDDLTAIFSAPEKKHRKNKNG